MIVTDFNIFKIILLKVILLFITMGLLAACEPANTQKTSMSSLLGQDKSGYRQLTNDDSIHFPQAHLGHPDYKIEWWYLTANLKTAAGEPLGLQWTQFRIAMAPKSISDESQSSLTSTTNDWASNQLYMAHAAITTKDSHLAQEKWSRAHPKLAGVTPSPLSIYLDNWRWQSDSNESLFPAKLNVKTADFDYQLQLSTLSPYQLQGNNGYSIKSADGEVASYYYSQPFIDIQGEVEIQGQRQKVTGQGWLDREWSSQFLKQSQQGWDWFALRLNDGSTLMLFQLRGEPNFYSGRRMFSDGSGHSIASSDIKMQAVDWHDIDNNRYPITWQIEVAQEQLNLTLNALNPNAKMSLTTQYWEGPVTVSGSHQGQGYMELTGYE